jgi:nicotinate-nucleotide pyrophosphorylase (carboxylating)
MTLNNHIQQSVKIALQEDIGTGDLTGELIAKDYQCSAALISREKAIFCGTAWFNETFKQVDSTVQIEWHIQDGDVCQINQVLCTLHGLARSLFTAERTAMNFVQTLSATATQTSIYVAKVKNTHCQILDTRKTLPGLRLAQKYAVTQGGGYNHRAGLYDAILIKENHVQSCGGIKPALKQAYKIVSAMTPKPLVEIEVENLNEFKEALAMNVQRMLLDNFSIAELEQAVLINQGQSELEASGNITLATVESYAQTGVDFISIGAITKHIKALDLSLRIS